MDWYENNIEEPIREIVKELRSNGINTFCSCGHRMWIQCESYYEFEESKIIYDVLVGKFGIKKYRTVLIDDIDNEHRNKVLEIQIPVNGKYYCRIMQDNPEFKGNQLNTNLDRYKIIVDGEPFYVKKIITPSQIKTLAGCNNEHYVIKWFYDENKPEEFRIFPTCEIMDLSVPDRTYIFNTIFVVEI
jgi:hypothetical protein